MKKAARLTIDYKKLTFGKVRELSSVPDSPPLAAEFIRNWLVKHELATAEQAALLSRRDLFATLKEVRERIGKP